MVQRCARIATIGGLLALAASATLLAQAGDRARTEALARRASERLEALRHEADQLAAQERTLLGDLRQLEIHRQIKTEDVRRIDGEIESVAAELNATARRAGALDASVQAARPALRARLVEIYKLGRGRYLRLVLSTSDLRRVGQAARNVSALAAHDRDRFARYQRTLEELRTTTATLKSRRGELEALRTGAAQARDAATRAVAARDALIRDIDQRRDLNARLAGELQVAQQKLQAALRDMGATSNGGATLPLGPFRGDLVWPVEGAVRPRAGRDAAGRQGGGVELLAAEGTPVRAVHDGTVAFAGAFAGFGTLVIVDHGAQAFSLYGNLLDAAVARGTQVDAGRTLGSVGSSPTGLPALYFELRVDGRPVDPLQWLKKKP